MTTDVTEEPFRVPRPAFTRLAVNDLIQGFLRWNLWASLGWADVKARYRRSVIGPFWITLTLGIQVLGLGVVYSALFHQTMHDYLPYVGVGFIVWGLISTLLNEGCMTFIEAAPTIKQIPFPLSTFAYRAVFRNFIVLLHNAIIYAIIVVAFGIRPGLACLLALPGIFLVIMMGLGFALFFGVFSARYRDIPQSVASFTQLIFFVTPLLWHREVLQSRAWIAGLNPFTYMLDVVREPLLGNVPPPFEWEIATAFAFTSFLAGLILFLRYRWRIPYWL
jgi:ABC-type polysaccharide/polyol phosphate export permease